LDNPTHKIYFPFTYRCVECRDILSSKNNDKGGICNACWFSGNYEYDDFSEDYDDDNYD